MGTRVCEVLNHMFVNFTSRQAPLEESATYFCAYVCLFINQILSHTPLLCLSIPSPPPPSPPSLSLSPFPFLYFSFSLTLQPVLRGLSVKTVDRNADIVNRWRSAIG